MTFQPSLEPPLDPPLPPARRSLRTWQLVLIGVAITAAIAVGGFLWLSTAIGGYSAGTKAADSAGLTAEGRDKKLGAADPAGGKACDLVDIHLAGLGRFEPAAEQARAAVTPGIKAAAGDARALHAACAAAGANMTPLK